MVGVEGDPRSVREQMTADVRKMVANGELHIVGTHIERPTRDIKQPRMPGGHYIHEELVDLFTYPSKPIPSKREKLIQFRNNIKEKFTHHEEAFPMLAGEDIEENPYAALRRTEKTGTLRYDRSTKSSQRFDYNQTLELTETQQTHPLISQTIVRFYPNKSRAELGLKFEENKKRFGSDATIRQEYQEELKKIRRDERRDKIKALFGMSHK